MTDEVVKNKDIIGPNNIINKVYQVIYFEPYALKIKTTHSFQEST